MPSYSGLLKEEDAQNWIKASLALQITKEGLEDFVEDGLQCVHSDIYNSVRSANCLPKGAHCTTCFTENLLQCPTRIKCNMSRICKFHTVNRYKPCPNNICEHARDEIIQRHRFSGPSWKNTNADNWCTSPWEIAKCFLPPDGYKTVPSIQNSDFNGVISLLINCKDFEGKLSFNVLTKSHLLTELRKIGRAVRHSSSLKVTGANLHDYLNKLRTLLNDSKELANRPDAKRAVDELDNLESDGFTICPEKTDAILNEDLRLRLASHYRDNLAYMPISPIRPDRDAKLSMFYVTPKIVEKNHRTPETEDIDVTRYKDLFGPEFQKNNIFLVGEPGRGKSTVSANCALEWSRQHLRMDTNETMQRDTNFFSDTDYFESVEFMFHIKLRDACEFCDLNEIIKDQIIAQIYQPKDVDAGCKLAQKVLEDNNCIIIGDGLDEWTHPTDSLTDRLCRCPRDEKGVLPFRNSAIKANVLITTRPWRLSQHRVKDSKIQKYLDINGVSDKVELVDSVLSVLNGNTGTKRSKDFFTYVEQLGIENLLSVPIITMQLVCMWFECRTLSGSICDIYASMVDMLFGPSRLNNLETKKKKEIEMPDCISNKEMPDCISNQENVMKNHEVFIKLCRLAFITLFSREDKSVVVFEETTIKNVMFMSDQMVSLKSGILTERKSNSYGKKSSHFSFIHKTFQEFLAAVHLFLNEDEYEKIVNSRCIGDAGNVLDISQVFIFICGIKPALGVQMSFWIGEIIPKSSIDTTLMDYYDYEISRPDISIIRSIQDMIKDGYREAQKNNHGDIPLTLTHYITSFNDDATIQLMRINKCRVQSINTFGINVAGSDEELQEVFTSSSDSLTSVELDHRNGQYDLSQCHRLKHLSISGTNTTCVQVDTTNLTTCELNSVSSNVENYIMSSLNCTDVMSKLQTLILSYVEDTQLLCDTLPRLSQLQFIRICFAGLRESHFLPPDSITHIKLKHVTMTAEALRKLLKRMEKIPHPVKCVLRRCDVKPASDVKHIRQYVQDSNVFSLERYDPGMGYEKLDFVFKSNVQDSDCERLTEQPRLESGEETEEETREDTGEEIWRRICRIWMIIWMIISRSIWRIWRRV
ncbi:uncharacterized protein LOC128212071 [Mya arenaria]|uniref:uncharacterized protein LOC128212071 n=1 Tax=Mya arenaria TaxID=6604 RepID=UPI0022E04BBD|nr:uncharacterized protein LOC128212071 [Mya arenaria]